MSKPLLNQTAIVTGGSSGIGEGIAKAMAAAGANVVVNFAHGRDAADSIVQSIRSDGGTAISVGADVSSEQDVLAMFSQTLEEFQSIDILIANAGIQQDAGFTEMTLDQWNKVLGVNLTGQFLCAREATKQFIKQGVRDGVSCAAGKIICMSSVHQIIPWAGHVNYAASKGGVDLMMKSIAQEIAGHRIRVNSIAPGAIQTPINKPAWDNKESLDALMTLIPYGRIGVPEDIAKAAVWLASDESDYVHGTTLYVDGGMTLYPGFADNG
ncbi:glucose 1-dehydrogenase [Allorhodopirellula heiligendammensis]|uniref:Glucose 1-dehydrogenase n=1 Tax=Allorhodopirellula heiligendammensis TaxID=2714739 RepID=A0A5C6BXZ4_9BACT|nr:glucose 1-dehydrogenase [Allorhodopirellula heiligendammensis]TWU16652.1 Glucose 1-dehydrogenase [Allorhodopirellula heiligendammensis]